MRRRAVALAVPLALLGAILAITGGGEHASGPEAGRRAGQSARGAAIARSASHPRGHGGRAIGSLQPGSDPSVLPGPILIADRNNNRLLEISPKGRVLWRFPEAGDLAPGQTFQLPDDAFFTPDGSRVVVTQEDDFVISIVDVARHRIVYRYGHPGVPGSEPDFVHNPDDAMLGPSGKLIVADIKNCRVLIIRPPAHRPLRQLGATGDCEHRPGLSYGSPNGAFPMSDGNTAITEINGDWLDVVAPGGHLVAATHPPGFTYPSDTNEVRPGLFISADYTYPGALETFTTSGRLRWRFQPPGAQALDYPSLALPLPNGDVLANDDKNDRVIVVDPRTNRIVWQYGHTHVPGSAEGFLNNPDGVDLTAPHSMVRRFAATMRMP
jgi:hypothetical protein